jgi:hypothetical protein
MTAAITVMMTTVRTRGVTWETLLRTPPVDLLAALPFTLFHQADRAELA